MVGIVEDDDELRGYLSAIIAEASGLKLAFAAGSIRDAEEMARAHPADVCLIDIQLPDGNGLDFAAHLKATSDAKALILTVLGDRQSVLQALHVGADGYLLKDTPPDQICRDIRSAFEGAAPISPRAAAYLLQSFKRTTPSGSASKLASPLTDREGEILRLFAQGRSYKEAAAALGVSANTIGAHVKSIYAKLDVNSRSRAIFEAGQSGWLDDPDA